MLWKSFLSRGRKHHIFMHACGLLFQIDGSFCCQSLKHPLHNPHPAAGQGMAQSVPVAQEGQEPIRGVGLIRALQGYGTTQHPKPRPHEPEHSLQTQTHLHTAAW